MLAIPAVLLGVAMPERLWQAGLLGIAVFVALLAIGATLLASDRAVAWVGRTWIRIGTRLRPRKPPPADLPERWRDQRDLVRTALGRRWWEAVTGGAGRWLFDWLTLVTALAAVGQHPRPTLILLSFCAAQLLAQVPITPGGLGVVEAGLTGTLVLIGVPAGAAAVATLAYRLVSYWLALPAGGVAYLIHRRYIRRGHVSVPRISALSLTRPGRVGRLRHHLDPVPGGAAHERPRSVPGVAAGRELEPRARERGERGLVVVRDDRDMALVRARSDRRAASGGSASHPWRPRRSGRAASAGPPSARIRAGPRTRRTRRRGRAGSRA